MVLARTRIHQAQLLLEVPREKIAENMAQAQKLARAMKYYYLSPVFIASGGCGLVYRLEEKYGINDKFKFCDLFMAVPTALFSDEFFLFVQYVVAITLMCMVWFPAWHQSAYDQGYNHVFGYSDLYGLTAFDYACDGSDNGVCKTCNTMVYCYSPNSTIAALQCGIGGSGGCNSESPVNCPFVDATAMATIMNATQNATTQIENDGYFVDPNSFINDTYVTYMLFGGIYDADWGAIICNRTVYAQYQAHWVKTYWILSFVGIIICMICVHIIINIMFYCCHNVYDNINPENYRIVRRASYERLSQPIAAPASDIVIRACNSIN